MKTSRNLQSQNPSYKRKILQDDFFQGYLFIF